MKKNTLLTAIPLLMAAQFSQAELLDIEITNLTNGIHFTPILISAHGDTTHLFMPGMAASDELQAMAEGGDISGLDSMLISAGATNVLNPAGGLLAPATSVTSMNFDSLDQSNLSIVAMMLPTNDGFIGLDAWDIPEEAGTYTIYLNAYDAGTEANDEIVNGAGTPGAAGIPFIPNETITSTASGVTDSEQNQMVHIHRGNVGDTDIAGGVSDLDSRVHRWLNPVAKVVVTVK